MTRVYLPTFAELIDRLTIVQLKAIFIPENKDAYNAEIALIMQDIDAIIGEKSLQFDARNLHAALVTMLVNRCIWEAESKARAGGDSDDKNLKYTHSLNGVRATAKNIIAHSVGDRKDLKIDCWAASLDPAFGSWDIFKKSVGRIEADADALEPKAKDHP